MKRKTYILIILAILLTLLILLTKNFRKTSPPASPKSVPAKIKSRPSVINSFGELKDVGETNGSTLLVDFGVLVEFFDYIRPGMEFSLTMYAHPHKVYSGSIKEIPPLEKMDSGRTFLVIGEVPNQKKELKPGMVASITIKLEKQ